MLTTSNNKCALDLNVVIMIIIIFQYEELFKENFRFYFWDG